MAEGNGVALSRYNLNTLYIYVYTPLLTYIDEHDISPKIFTLQFPCLLNHIIWNKKITQVIH